jgi:hypothetical protein
MLANHGARSVNAVPARFCKPFRAFDRIHAQGAGDRFLIEFALIFVNRVMPQAFETAVRRHAVQAHDNAMVNIAAQKTTHGLKCCVSTL